MRSGWPTHAWVYLHRDAEDRVIYVGLTGDLRRRTRVHKKSSPWRDRIARVDVDGHYAYGKGLSRENELIRQYRPEFNVRGNPAVLEAEAERKMREGCAKSALHWCEAGEIEIARRFNNDVVEAWLRQQQDETGRGGAE